MPAPKAVLAAIIAAVNRTPGSASTTIAAAARRRAAASMSQAASNQCRQKQRQNRRAQANPKCVRQHATGYDADEHDRRCRRHARPTCQPSEEKRDAEQNDENHDGSDHRRPIFFACVGCRRGRVIAYK